MAYNRSVYSDMYSPDNMFGVSNTNAANNFNNQLAFRPGSLKDTQIKNQQMYQDEGYPAPKLDQLKQEDWKQFQKKGIPLSLPRNQYKGIEGWTADAGNVMNDASNFTKGTIDASDPKVNLAGFNFGNFIDNFGKTNERMTKDKAWYDNITFLNNNPFISLGRLRNPMLPKSFHKDWSEMGNEIPQTVDTEETVTQETAPNVWEPGIKHKGMPQEIDETDETTAFNFPGITSLKNMFQRPEAKQKEFDMYQQTKGPGGWGDIGGGYQGNIWGGNKLNVYDPASGQMVLRDKNFDSMFGSESVEEMLGKKEAWARKRRTKGEDYLSEALKGWLDELDRKKGGVDGPEKGPTTDRAKIEAYTGRPMSDYRASRPPSERGFTGHGKSGMGRDPSDRMAYGGRVGYNQGGRVGILSVF